jgi:ATP-binding cassette, subfamily G (WHITE), member 2
MMILDCMAATSVATAGIIHSTLITHLPPPPQLLCAVVACCCVSIELTTVVMAGIFEMCRLYGGFFTSPLQLKDYPHWKFADALSYIKYAFVSVALNELTGLELTCTQAQKDSGRCITSGQTIIEQRGYDQYNQSFLFGILIVYIVGARLIAYCGLRFFKK